VYVLIADVEAIKMKKKTKTVRGIFMTLSEHINVLSINKEKQLDYTLMAILAINKSL